MSKLEEEMNPDIEQSNHTLEPGKKPHRASKTKKACTTNYLLPEQIRKLRGRLTQERLAKECGLAVRTIAGVERGEKISLNTLRRIARVRHASREQELNLLIGWFELEIGQSDFRELRVSYRMVPESPKSARAQLVELIYRYQVLTDEDKRQVLKALKNKKVVAALSALNALSS